MLKIKILQLNLMLSIIIEIKIIDLAYFWIFNETNDLFYLFDIHANTNRPLFKCLMNFWCEHLLWLIKSVKIKQLKNLFLWIYNIWNKKGQNKKCINSNNAQRQYLLK